MQIATSTCEILATSSTCTFIVDDYISILYIPIFLILFFVVLLNVLTIFDFKNHWKN